jgi:ankyrin repeat protein
VDSFDILNVFCLAVKAGCVIDYNEDDLKSLGVMVMGSGGLSELRKLPIGSVATRIQILAFINRKIDMLANDIGVTADELMLNLLQESDVHSTTKSGGTALHFAAKRGNVQLLQQLISIKADVNAQDNKGNGPLNLATDTECILALKRQGADGWTELMIAASVGDLPKVKSLAVDKAKVVAANRDQRTALHFAAENGHHIVVQASSPLPYLGPLLSINHR